MSCLSVSGASRSRHSWLFRICYPHYTDEDIYFNRILAKYVPATGLVLDAGCGTGQISQLDYAGVRHVIGMDRDAGLAENTAVSWLVCADLERIPLGSATVDSIVCKYVVEHLQEPSRVFQEFARVLRPGGYVLIHTPNQYHYVQWVARLIPQRFHPGLIRRVCGRASFPKCRRANTPRALTRLMALAGLPLEQMYFFESAPDYLEPLPPLYILGVAYERLVNSSPRFASWRLNMIGVFQK